MLFNEERHTYERNGIVYTSVSEFIRKFKPKFEKEAIANAVAKKSGKTPQEITDKWELNAQISTNYGTSVHKGIEYWIRFGEISKLPHIKLSTEKFAEKFKGKKLESEIVVFDDELKLAGTIDQLELLGNKAVNIIDVKTNYEIDKEKRGYMLSPIQNIPNTKLNSYRLQLSMYKYLMERNGFTVNSIQLEHWEGNEYTTIPLEPIDVKILIK